MNLIKRIILLYAILLLSACASYKSDKSSLKKEKVYYSSAGFALVYEEDFYKQGVINKKLNNEQVSVMHSFLKGNTPIRIINPKNSKVIETKVSKKAVYPKIFNVVVSKKIAEILELDVTNPYVEVFEIKMNKTFIAKEGNMFEEEKKVAGNAPVDEVKMDDLTKTKPKKEIKLIQSSNFVLVISDFYYLVSANNLMHELTEKTQINNFSVEKIGDNQYRLSAGPFKDFNSLKFTYISLNNLGFEELNIYRE